MRWQFVVVIVLLAVWHGWPFLVGYRLTADSVFFLESYLGGPARIWHITEIMAEGHGRIGFYGLMPLNILAAYLAEFDGWRALFVALYISLAALTFAYAARLLRTPLTPIAFLIWLALHPLLFEHTPPNAYPLQNTLPFLVLIGIRYWGLKADPKGLVLWLGLALQAFTMLLSEYATLLGMVLIGGEALMRHPLQWRHPVMWLAALFRDSRTLRDLIMLAFVLGLYLAYRLIHDGTYEGVQLEAASSLWNVAYTTFFHVVNGLSPSRFGTRLLEAPFEAWVLATLAGLIMAVAGFWALARLKRPLPVLGISVYLFLGILLVTLPLSLTAKQQGWCVNGGICAYLDSRTSILGVVVILTSILTLLPLELRIVRVGMAGLLGALFALTSIYNWQVSRDMRPYAVVWERGQMLSCAPDLIPATHEYRRNLIDPDKIVPGNTHIWQQYLETIQPQTDCEADHPVLQDARNQTYLPLIAPGQEIEVRAGSGVKFLGLGWSTAEPSGVWTDNRQAELLIAPRDVSAGESASLDIRGHFYFDEMVQSQELIVRLDGEILWQGSFTPESQSPCCQIKVPLPENQDKKLLRLELELPDAKAPESGGDQRTLGLFLKGLRLAT